MMFKSKIKTREYNNHFEYSIPDKNIPFKRLKDYTNKETKILDSSMNFWDKLLGINPRHRSNNKCKLYLYSADIMVIIAIIDMLITKNITLVTNILAPFIGLFMAYGFNLYDKVKHYDERGID